MVGKVRPISGAWNVVTQTARRLLRSPVGPLVRRTLCPSVVYLMLTPEPAISAWTVGKPIVTYYAGPGGGPGDPLTNAMATEMAQGGWNLVLASTVAELDTAQAHGLRAMWADSQDYFTVTSIRDHPALYSYFVTEHPATRAMVPDGWCDDGWFHLIEGGKRCVLESAPACDDGAMEREEFST